MSNLNFLGNFDDEMDSFIPAEQVNEYVKNAQNGDVKAFNKLIVSNQARIIHIINDLKISDKFYRDPDFAKDVFSEGSVGFVKAVRNFSFEKGANFYSYANLCIRGTILDFLNTSSSIHFPKRVYQQVYNIKKAAAGVQITSDNAAEIAEETNLTPDQVLELSHYNYHTTSLFKNNGSSDEEFCVADTEDICYSTDVQYSYEKQEFLDDLQLAVKSLPEREQFIINNHLGYNGGSTLSFEAIGNLLGISKARTQQLFVGSCKKLGSAKTNPYFEGYIAE